MHNTVDYTLYFKVERSTYKVSLILIIHFLSFVACFLNGLSTQYQLILFFFVGVSLIIQLFGYTKQCTACLKCVDGNGWALAFDSHAFIPIDIATTTILTSLFTVLYFRQGEAKKILLIFKDAMSDKEYRKLRVTLKTTGLNSGKHGDI